jgi:hypothetical protein
MKNNNQDNQDLNLPSIFSCRHGGLNAVLIRKILSFSICFGIGFQVSFISNFGRDSQLSSIASASVVSQPKTVSNRLIVPQNNRSSLLSQVIEPLVTNGRGSLEVSNGTSRDAYLKVVDPLTNQLVAAFFVESGLTFTLEEIPDGDYEVLFVLGEVWDSSTRSFTRNKSYAKFDSPLEFITRELYNGIEYSILKATLHEVVDGNTTTSAVTEGEFEKYKNHE